MVIRTKSGRLFEVDPDDKIFVKYRFIPENERTKIENNEKIRTLSNDIDKKEIERQYNFGLNRKRNLRLGQ